MIVSLQTHRVRTLDSKAQTDLEAAAALNRARARLFKLIQRESDPHRRRSA